MSVKDTQAGDPGRAAVDAARARVADLYARSVDTTATREDRERYAAAMIAESNLAVAEAVLAARPPDPPKPLHLPGGLPPYPEFK